MIAITFEVTPKSHKKADYLELAGEMRPFIEEVEGFISVERFQSLTNPEKLLSISFFEDEAAFDRWRKLAAPLRLKWSGKFGQRAKLYPTRTNGYEDDKTTEFFRPV